ARAPRHAVGSSSDGGVAEDGRRGAAGMGGAGGGGGGEGRRGRGQARRNAHRGQDRWRRHLERREVRDDARRAIARAAGRGVVMAAESEREGEQRDESGGAQDAPASGSTARPYHDGWAIQADRRGVKPP